MKTSKAHLEQIRNSRPRPLLVLAAGFLVSLPLMGDSCANTNDNGNSSAYDEERAHMDDYNRDLAARNRQDSLDESAARQKASVEAAAERRGW